MSRRSREFIGRAALFLLGAMILFGGYKCIAAGIRLDEEWRQQQTPRGYYRTRSASGSGLPYFFGGVLLLLGAPLAFAAVVPTAVFARFFGPPKLTMGDNDVGIDPDSPRTTGWDWW